MKLVLSVIILGIALAGAAEPTDSGSTYFFLIPKRTSFIPGEECVVDMYLLNRTGGVLKVPSLDAYEAVYHVSRPGSAGSLPRVGGTGPIYSHDLVSETIKPHGMKHSATKIAIKADIGELVELYVELGDKSRIRSNTVLLRCVNSEERSPEEKK